MSEWILNSRTKEGEGRRRAPSYIVSAILFWGLYTAMFYSFLSPETTYYIAVPLVASLSFVANLAFEWAWNGVAMARSDKSRRVPSQVTIDTTVPLLDETEDSESLPIPPAEDYIRAGEETQGDSRLHQQYQDLLDIHGHYLSLCSIRFLW